MTIIPLSIRISADRHNISVLWSDPLDDDNVAGESFVEYCKIGSLRGNEVIEYAAKFGLLSDGELNEVRRRMTGGC